MATKNTKKHKKTTCTRSGISSGLFVAFCAFCGHFGNAFFSLSYLDDTVSNMMSDTFGTKMLFRPFRAFCCSVSWTQGGEYARKTREFVALG
jgi:putative Mn2+ efflux pump MntP